MTKTMFLLIGGLVSGLVGGLRGADLTVEFTRADFATYPQVQYPIAIDVDVHGRVFVAEGHRYGQGIVETNQNPQRALDDLKITSVAERDRQLQEWLAAGELDKDLEAAKSAFSDAGDGRNNFLTKYSDRVACLMDTDHDGRADRRTEFATGFNQRVAGPAAGVLAWDGKVWLTCIPDLWLLEDRNGDQIADTTTSLAHGFGVRSGWLGHDLHGLAWGPDGRIYFTMADRGYHVRTAEGRLLYGPLRGAVFRCWPDGSELEEFARGLRNPQELAFDDYGNLFTGDNNCDAGDQARIEHIVAGGDYGWEVSYQDLPHRGPWLREHMWELRYAKDDPNYPAWIIPPVGHLAAGPSGLAAYPGVGLPERYRGHFFLCDFRGGGNGSIHAFKPVTEGAGFTLTDVHTIENGVGVADVTFGYDGRMYVADWGKAWEVNDACRIYTLAHEPSRTLPIVAETQRLAAEGMKARPVTDLCQFLGHADRRIRLLAQLELTRRPEAEVVPRVLAVAQRPGTHISRVHALWTLGMLARHSPSTVRDLLPLLADTEAEIRAQTAQVLGEARYAPAVTQLIGLLTDANPRVRMKSGLALARLADAAAIPALLALAQQNDDHDVLVRHAVVCALAASVSTTVLVEKTVSHPARAVRLAAVLALRRNEAPEVAAFLADADAQIVTEAARAIYDRKIVAAMSALAGSLDRQHFPEGLRGEGYLRRAIAANLINGSARAARRVAQAAALPEDSGMPDAFRLVALETLMQWDAPAPRDAVWGRWEPLPSRAAGQAKAAIIEFIPRLIGAATGEVLNQAKQLENQFGTEKSVADLARLISDETQPDNLRIDYLKTLHARGPTTDAQTVTACRSLLADATIAPRLRIAARATLCARRPNDAFTVLNDALTSSSVSEQQAAVLALGERGMIDGPAGAAAEQRLLALGEMYLTDTLDQILAVELLEVARSRAAKVPAWARIIAEYDARRVQAKDPLAAHRFALRGGDAEIGKAVFLNHQGAQCLRCHAIGGHGGGVGPDLTGVASRHTPETLLESLIVPTAKIADGFGVVTITRKDGTLVGGVLQSRSVDAVTLLDGTRPRTIPMTEIAAISAPVSAMPPMGTILSPRELRDVLAYLLTLK